MARITELHDEVIADGFDGNVISFISSADPNFHFVSVNDASDGSSIGFYVDRQKAYELARHFMDIFQERRDLETLKRVEGSDSMIDAIRRMR